MSAPSSAFIRLTAIAGLGVLAFTACGNQATSEAQNTSSASASATTVTASPSPSPTPSVTSTPATETVSAQPSAEETTPEAPAPETPETTEVVEQAAEPESTADPVQAFDQEAYRSAITNERVVYEFDAAGLDCYVYEDGASCWRPAVEFPTFPVEYASAGETVGYKFGVMPEVDPATVMTEKLELPVGQSITNQLATCTNLGDVVRCEARKRWFEMNATIIEPTPNNLLNQ